MDLITIKQPLASAPGCPAIQLAELLPDPEELKAFYKGVQVWPCGCGCVCMCACVCACARACMCTSVVLQACGRQKQTRCLNRRGPSMQP
jgi:hypothetical protein